MRLIDFLAQDYAQTKRRACALIKLVRDYHYFKQRGFTRKASFFNARNAIN